MAESHFNSDKDRAYIENLLSRLRETLGQPAPTAESEASTPTTPEAETAPEVAEPTLEADETAAEEPEIVSEIETVVVVDEEEMQDVEEHPVPEEAPVLITVCDEAQEEPIPEETPSVPEESEEQSPLSEETEDEKQASAIENPVNEEPLLETETSDEVVEEIIEETAETDVISEQEEEATIEETPVAEAPVQEELQIDAPIVEEPILDEPARAPLLEEPLAIAQDIVEEIPPQEAETPIDEDIPVPTFFSSTPVRTNEAYAHRVVPGMAYYAEQSGQRTAPRHRDLYVPDLLEEETTLQDGQYTISLPIPDRTQPADAQPEIADTYIPQESDILADIGGTAQQMSFFDNLDDGEVETSTHTVPVADGTPSVWDVVDLGASTASTQPTLEASTAVETEEDKTTDGNGVPKKQHIGPRFWEFRVPTKTYTDVSYTSDGTLVDRILEEPEEGLGEGSKEQIALWKKEIKRKSLITGIQCISVGFIALLLFLYELFPNMTATVMKQLLLTRVPGALVLIDLQLLLLACLVSYRFIFRGIEALRYRRVLPETLASLSAVAAVFFDIILYAVKPTTPILVGLVGVLSLLGACLGEFFRIKGLACAFTAYEAEGNHIAAILTEGQKHTLLNNLYVDATMPIWVLEAEPTCEISGFVGASRTRKEGHKAAFIACAIALVAFLVDLIVLLATGQGGGYSFWSAFTTFCGVLPLTAFVTHRFFFFALSWRLAKERVGVASEDTVYEYADTHVMAYDDVEAFPNGSVKVNGIKLCGDFRLDKALYLVASLFDRVGGPLNGVFRVSTQDVQLSSDVMIREIHDNGIEAQVGHEDVSVGTKAFLTSIGVKVFDDPEDDRASEGKNHVLYVAYKAQLCAKFYLQYQMNELFERNVEYCAKNEVSTVIMTADPILNEALIDEISYISDYDVRVVKKSVADLEQGKQISSATTLITHGPRKTLRRMPFFFRAYVKRQRLAAIISLGLVILGGALVPTLMALFHAETALIPFLYQIVSLAPAVGIGISVGQLDPNK